MHKGKKSVDSVIEHRLLNTMAVKDKTKKILETKLTKQKKHDNVSGNKITKPKTEKVGTIFFCYWSEFLFLKQCHVL